MTIDDDSGKEGLDKMKITDEGVWEGRGVETIHIGWHDMWTVPNRNKDEIKYKMIICLFVSAAGCILPEIYSLRNKSSAHFIFALISRKGKCPSYITK